jgi:p-aminobenzoyl-glutamate transporter AbgT
LKENGGKFIINQHGNLEQLPSAFILPWILIVILSVYTFIKSYKKTEKKILRRQQAEN